MSLIRLFVFFSLSTLVSPKVCEQCFPSRGCQCPTTTPPTSAKNLPQFVLFTFLGPINELAVSVLKNLFPLDRKNRDGCPMSATVFVTANETSDHCLAGKLYERGFDIALNGWGGRPQYKWIDIKEEDMKKEVLASRKHVKKCSGIPATALQGWRTPRGQSGGDVQFKVLKDSDIVWDASFKRGPIEPQNKYLWPYTLDVMAGEACGLSHCPTMSYPGLWAVPTTLLYDTVNKKLNDSQPKTEWCFSVERCDSGDALDNEDNILHFLRYNYDNIRGDNQAPVVFNFEDIKWFKRSAHAIGALNTFLDQLAKEKVFVVGISDMVAWLKKKVPLRLLQKRCPSRSALKCRRSSQCSANLVSDKKLDELTRLWRRPPPPGAHLWWLYEIIFFTIALAFCIWKDRQEY